MTTEWKPGINHIEFWVSNLNNSMLFYSELMELIGWKKHGETAFSTGTTEIYFKEVDAKLLKTLGPRHFCFQAISRQVVDEVGKLLIRRNARVIRGPVERNEYSAGYYTVDFYDPNGYILEVSYTPNMVM